MTIQNEFFDLIWIYYSYREQNSAVVLGPQENPNSLMNANMRTYHWVRRFWSLRYFEKYNTLQRTIQVIRNEGEISFSVILQKLKVFRTRFQSKLWETSIILSRNQYNILSYLLHWSSAFLIQMIFSIEIIRSYKYFFGEISQHCRYQILDVQVQCFIGQCVHTDKMNWRNLKNESTTQSRWKSKYLMWSLWVDLI